MKKLMTIAAALLCGTLFAEELNVASGDTVTLTEDKTVDGGTVAGTLILESGVKLTLARGIFTDTAIVEMRGATIEGFSGADSANVALPNAFVIADGTENAIRNTTDAYTQEGCNVTMSGSVTGSGTLNYVSTGRGFYFNGNYSGFTGIINLDISAKSLEWFVCESSGIQSTGEGSVWNFNAFPEGKEMRIAGNGGAIRLGNFCATAKLLSANGNNPSIVTGTRVMNRVWAGKLEGSDAWTEWGTVHCSFGTFDKSDGGILTIADSFSLPTFQSTATYQIDVRSGTLVMDDDWSSHAVAALNGTVLSGKGTIGTLKTWENNISVSNPQNSTLTISDRQSGDTGVLTITGEAGSRSGNPVLEVTDTSKFNVQLSSALAADGWKLKEESGVYSIYKNGLMIVIR